MNIKKIIETNYKNEHIDTNKGQYIKKGNLYIPYFVPNFDCIVQDIMKLNIFYASIMKLIEIGVKETDKIATTLGIEERIFREVVTDLVFGDMIFTSENNLYLTTKGFKALKDNKEIVRYKNTFNKIGINTITNNFVYVEEEKFVEPEKNFISLYCDDLNDDYLRSNVNEITRIYEKIQENESGFTHKEATKEIYKIIKINYTKTCYKRLEYKIYINPSTCDVNIQFKGNDGAIYENVFFDQIKENEVRLKNFFVNEYTRRNIKKEAGLKK